MTASREENFVLIADWRAIVDEYSTAESPKYTLRYLQLIIIWAHFVLSSFAGMSLIDTGGLSTIISDIH